MMDYYRTQAMRSDLYHAIAAGDIDKAQDVMNLMMMVGIDDLAIIKANRASRPAVEVEVKPFPLPQGPPGTFMAPMHPDRPKRRQAKGMERG